MAISDAVTLLFTDIESSSLLIERSPADYARALGEHNELLRRICAHEGGEEFHDAGDGLYFAFSECARAAAAAAEAQRVIRDHAWPAGVRLRVRMALHLCAREFREGQYRGPGMHLNARLLAAGHGGQILCSEMVSTTLASDHCAFIGSYRLRGLAGTHRIHQLSWGKETRDFPPLRAEHARRHNLPALADAFIGRRREIELLREAIVAEGTRLITLEGPGGMGKTRLAIESARPLLDEFDHAVTFVGFSSCPDSILLPQVLADALGCVLTGKRDPLESAISELTGYRSLLILDNLEHLGDGACAFVATLLERLPDCALLVTSRRALGLAGEKTLTLTSLTVEGDESCEALDLLVARGSSQADGFVLTEDNRVPLLAVCRQLDGIPLALELAAARLDLLDPAALLDSLAAAAELGKSGPLGQVIEWSVAHLPPDTLRVFRQLGLFRGGTTAAAAQEICEVDTLGQMLGHLHFLRHARLLRPGGPGRYVLPEPVRQSAMAALGDAAPATRVRQVRYLTAAARRTSAQVGSPQERCAVDDFAREMDNVIDALRHCGDRGLTLRLVIACHYFSLNRGMAKALRPFLPSQARLDLEGTEGRVAARAWHAAGLIEMDQEHLEEAAFAFRKAEKLFQEHDERKAAITALHNLAIVAEMGDAFGEAASNYREVLEYFRAEKMGRETSAALLNLATCEARLGALDQAVLRAEEALELIQTESLNEGSRLSACLTLADLYLRAGDLARARSAAEAGLGLAREMGRLPSVLRALVTLAQICWGSRNPGETRERVREARAMAEAAGLTISLEQEEALSIAEKRATSGKSSVSKENVNFVSATQITSIAS